MTSENSRSRNYRQKPSSTSGSFPGKTNTSQRITWAAIALVCGFGAGWLASSWQRGSNTYTQELEGHLQDLTTAKAELKASLETTKQKLSDEQNGTASAKERERNLSNQIKQKDDALAQDKATIRTRDATIKSVCAAIKKDSRPPSCAPSSDVPSSD